jgi:hypothetical protein
MHTLCVRLFTLHYWLFAQLAQSQLLNIIAEPLGLATQEKMDSGLIFATCTNKDLVMQHWSSQK